MLLAAASPVAAQVGGAPVELRLSLSDGLRAAAVGQPEAEKPGAADAGEAPKAAPVFGRAGPTGWLSVGTGGMHNFQDDGAGEIHVGYSRFIADELEFNLELTGWYFSQTGDDTGGISPFMNLRWHFLHDEGFDWSVFGEFGFGLLFAFDNVPDGGTGFNFLPRLGAGFTKQISDDGTRLVTGLRWQHISNGRIEGDTRNPGRDSLMFYVGVMFPF